MTTVTYETETPGGYPATLRVRELVFPTDLAPESGGTDTAPGPHDLFDASLASCQGATAMWFAKRKGFPLERVTVRVDSDDKDERAGVYRMTIHVELGGPLDDDQRGQIMRAIASCPIKKLMTTGDVQISYA